MKEIADLMNAAGFEKVREEAYTEAKIDAGQEYENGYDAGHNVGYQQGLSDAWEAARKIVALVKKLKLEDRVEYITFSYQGMIWLKELAPQGTPVYYLNGELSPSKLAPLGMAGIDYNIGVMREHPQWIDEAHSLGMKVNVWTVNSDRDMQWCINYGVDFITTNAPERLQQLLAP